jgi:hypothetical protein
VMEDAKEVAAMAMRAILDCTSQCPAAWQAALRLSRTYGLRRIGNFENHNPREYHKAVRARRFQSETVKMAADDLVGDKLLYQTASAVQAREQKPLVRLHLPGAVGLETTWLG